MSFSDKLTIAGILISLSGITISGTLKYIKSNKEKMKNVFKSPYVRAFTITLILSIVAAFVPWNKFHYGDNVKIVYRDKPTAKQAITPDTIKKALIKPIMPNKNTHTSLRHKKNIIVPAEKNISPTKKVKDTSKSSSKYDLSHATLSQSAVGDNAKVENYNSIKQRVLTDAIWTRIMLHVGSNKMTIVSVELLSTDEETNNFANEILLKLQNMGYVHLERGMDIMAGGVNFFNDLKIRNLQDGSVQILVPPENNTQKL
jgi:hypothetical protein